ncbi:MAG: aminoacyl-tRNA hydrolase [Firmicutes bacterium]|nr:aminoacyl-tRNA hydrolase [Bacillota bacterium]
MYLIVGLGNPGDKYSSTRHNIGFRVIYNLAGDFDITGTRHKLKAILAKGQIKNNRVILAQPQTYMNKSGESVKLILDYFKIPLNKVIVIYDDMDLPTGKIRIKTVGSPGGHNGLRSIINCLGTNKIPRIRVGIGRPLEGMATTNYVLGYFSKDEDKLINEAIKNISGAIPIIITDGFEAAMNKYN